MQDFKNLMVWQAARRLTRSVYELTVSFPQSEEFGLKAQMRRACVSICANIAEGSGRDGDREFRRFLYVSMGSTSELECEVILSFDLAFITEQVMNGTLAALSEIRRMLIGLISQLKTTKVTRPPVASNTSNESLPRRRRETGGSPKAGS
jgi:four helix bundle protein